MPQQVRFTDPATGEQRLIDVGATNEIALASSPQQVDIRKPVTLTPPVSPKRIAPTASPAPPSPDLSRALRETMRAGYHVLPEAAQEFLSGAGKQLQDYVEPLVDVAGTAVSEGPALVRDVARHFMNPETMQATQQGFTEGARAGVTGLTQAAIQGEQAIRPFVSPVDAVRRFSNPEAVRDLARNVVEGASGLDVEKMAKAPWWERVGRGSVATLAAVPLAIPGKLAEFRPLKGFYSRFEKEVLPRLSEKPQNIEKLRSLISPERGFVTQDEWHWIGGPQFLEEHRGTSVTRQQVADWFAENQTKLKEVRQGGKLFPEEQAATDAMEAASTRLDDTSAAAREAVPRPTGPEPWNKNAEWAKYHDERDAIGRLVSRIVDGEISAEELAAEIAKRPNVEQDALTAAEDFVKARRVVEEEHPRGSSRWDQYSIDYGREHYGEHLLTVPPKTVGEVPRHPPLEWKQGEPESRYVGREYGPTVTYTATLNQGTENEVHAIIRDYSKIKGRPAGEVVTVERPYMEGATERYATVEEAKAAVQAFADRALARKAEKDVTFKHSHFTEIPNYFLHQRQTVRKIEGVDTLFEEELQSDAHQAASRAGFREAGQLDLAKARLNEVDQTRHEAGTALQARVNEQPITAPGKGWPPLSRVDQLTRETGRSVESIQQQLETEGHLWGPEATAYTKAMQDYWAAKSAFNDAKVAPPKMPFAKKWEELGIRLMLRDAVAHGLSQIGWTSGKQQLDRYDRVLRDIQKIQVTTPLDMDRPLQIEVFDKSGIPFNPGGEAGMRMEQLFTTDQLADVLGKENAKRLMAQPASRTANNGVLRTLTAVPGAPISIGGRGMFEAYDTRMVSIGNKLGAPYGAKVEQQEIIERRKKQPKRGGMGDEENPWMDKDGHVQEEPPSDFTGTDYYEEFDEPEPEWDSDDFEANADDFQHSVDTDPSDFETDTDTLLEIAGESRYQFSEGTRPGEGQRKAFFNSDGHLLPDVTLEIERPADPRFTGAADTFKLRATRPGVEPEILARHSQEATVEEVKRLLEKNIDDTDAVEPTRWRYTYNPTGAHRDMDTSQWYNSERAAERAAEQHRDELDDAARDEQYDTWVQGHREEHREWQQRYDEHDEQQSRYRAFLEEAQERWQEQGEAPYNAAAVQPDEDPKMERVSHGKVWVLKIPEKMAKEIREKGQPLPQVALPLTGAGLAAYAASKQKKKQQEPQ